MIYRLLISMGGVPQAIDDVTNPASTYVLDQGLGAPMFTRNIVAFEPSSDVFSNT